MHHPHVHPYDLAREVVVLIEDDCHPVLVVGFRVQGYVRLASVFKLPKLELGRFLVQGAIGLKNKVHPRAEEPADAPPTPLKTPV